MINHRDCSTIEQQFTNIYQRTPHNLQTQSKKQLYPTTFLTTLYCSEPFAGGLWRSVSEMSLRAHGSDSLQTVDQIRDSLQHLLQRIPQQLNPSNIFK